LERKYTAKGQVDQRRLLSQTPGIRTLKPACNAPWLRNVAESNSEANVTLIRPGDTCRVPIKGSRYFEAPHPTSAFITPEPSRTPNTPDSEHNLREALSQISGYLDRLVESGSWRRRNEQPAFEIQKLAAHAHMAISGQSKGSPQTWQDLVKLGKPTFNVMPKLDCDGLLTLHPRALTALLRLVVDGADIPNAMPLWEAQTLRTVKDMFRQAAKMALPRTHPVPLLCGVQASQTQNLSARQFELMDVRLYARISHLPPDGGVFVAQEQIYGARVLASLGYVQWAEAKLSSVIADLPAHSCQYTYAEAHRTLGYVRQQACSHASAKSTGNRLRDAENNANLALQAFKKIGMGESNEALYTKNLSRGSTA